MPNTDKSKANLKPFTANDPKTGVKDPRINRKGYISSFALLRRLAQEVGNENWSKNESVAIFKKMLRDMAKSKANADRMGFLAYAVGKPKEEVDANVKVEEIVIRYANRDTPPPATSGSNESESGTQET